MTKSIQIILPNYHIINTSIEDDDGALFIYKKIQEVNPGFNEENLKIKKDISEDDKKLGEKEYDFGNIREGERILTFIIEPCYEKLQDVIPITRLSGLNLYGKEYIHGCRYHFHINNPIYNTTRSLSILYDYDFKKFGLEPSFHKRNYSLLTEMKPLMSSDRPKLNDNTTSYSSLSLNYKVNWYDTIRELLYDISAQEEGHSFSDESINNIEKLYEKHKLRFYN